MQLVNAQRPVQSAAYLLMGVLTAITISAEPLASALIGLVVAFGAQLTQDQIDALVTVVRLVSTILVSAGVVQYTANQTKSQVTPVGNPSLPAGSVVNVLGSDDQVEIQPTPPGSIDIQGGQDENDTAFNG